MVASRSELAPERRVDDFWRGYLRLVSGQRKLNRLVVECVVGHLDRTYCFQPVSPSFVVNSARLHPRPREEKSSCSSCLRHGTSCTWYIMYHVRDWMYAMNIEGIQSLREQQVLLYIAASDFAILSSGLGVLFE